MSKPGETYSRIYAVVRRISAGKVSTYGDMAKFAGFSRQARLVGYALHVLPMHSTGRDRKGAESEQRIRLEAEGIEFGIDGRISLNRFRWPG